MQDNKNEHTQKVRSGKSNFAGTSKILSFCLRDKRIAVYPPYTFGAPIWETLQKSLLTR